MQWNSRAIGVLASMMLVAATVGPAEANPAPAPSAAQPVPPTAPPPIPAPAPAPKAAGAQAPGPARILLYGDSLTHAFSSNWSWRYRLWQSLTEAGEDFDFVGPRNDVVEFTTKRFDSQDYRNPHFDRDHAALARTRFLNGPYQPETLARDYQPTVIVGLIGGNDVLQGADLDDLEHHWRKQIKQARKYAPGVDFILVQLPQTWTARFPEYNTMLARVTAKMDTEDERVVLTPLATLGPWTDTFDYLHLSTSGQLKVAAVVAQALADLGIGSGELATKPDPPDDFSWAPHPTASVSGATVAVRWPAVTYASSENVWTRDRSTGVVAVKRFATGQSTTLPGTAGHSYDLWLAPVQGFLQIGTRSRIIRVDIPAA